MNAIGFGQRLNGHVCTLVDVPHPGMSPNDGLDQTLVARRIRCTFALCHSCSARCLGRPRNLDLLPGAILVRDAGNLDQQLTLGDNDTANLSDAEGWTIESLLLMSCKSGENCALYLYGWNTPDPSRSCLASAQ